MDVPLASKCIFHREGKCYFVISYPTKCNLCFNFVTSDPGIKRKYGFNKTMISLYDILKVDKSFKTLFPSSGDEIQTIFEVE
ncbi:MAG: hypothetical protein ACP5SF_05225 [Thermoplasmata archaeon]